MAQFIIKWSFKIGLKTWSSMYSCMYTGTGILKNLILKWKSNEFFANISDDNNKNQQISKFSWLFFTCKWNVILEFETDKEDFSLTLYIIKLQVHFLSGSPTHTNICFIFPSTCNMFQLVHAYLIMQCVCIQAWPSVS